MIYSQSLSLVDIQTRISRNQLPKEYYISNPFISIYSLISTLSLFNNDQQMLKFIDKVYTNARIKIIAYNIISMGSITNFIQAYAQLDLLPPGLSSHKQHLILQYFKNNLRHESQLAYLINYVHFKHLNTLLEHCFDRKLLFNLVNDPNYVFSFYHAANTALYYHLNPKQQHPSSTPLLDIYYWTSRAGHALGLTSFIQFQFQNRAYKLEPSGQFPQISLNLLMQAVDSYVQKHPSKIFDTILTAFTNCLALMENVTTGPYKDMAYQVLYRRYQNKELVYLSHCWVGHCIGLAFFGKYLIYCNRGYLGDPRFGSKIYEIKDVNNINENLFKQLTQRSNTSQDTFNILNKIIDLSMPLVKFRSKPQKRGTCSMANSKATIEPMIVLVQVGPDATPQEVISLFQQEYKRTKYKHLTTFIRRREIDELLKSMLHANHPELIYFFAALTRNIIYEHHGKNRGYIKDKLELEQAKYLFDRVPENVKQILILDPYLMNLVNYVEAKNQELQLQKTCLSNYDRRKNFAKNNQMSSFPSKIRPCR
ncbi:MAG: hypothetical protein JSS07_08140 [Proteobacteria bacterium]|nr:hypothetical protein [Pseudomonadota bacterium]